MAGRSEFFNLKRVELTPNLNYGKVRTSLRHKIWREVKDFNKEKDKEENMERYRVRIDEFMVGVAAIIVGITLFAGCISGTYSEPNTSDASPDMMLPEAPSVNPVPTLSPGPTPTPTPHPEGVPKVPTDCRVTTYNTDVLIGYGVKHLKVGLNNDGFAVSWYDNSSSLPFTFQSFDWDGKELSPRISLADQLNWIPSLVGGEHDYLMLFARQNTAFSDLAVDFSASLISSTGAMSKKYYLRTNKYVIHPEIVFDGKYYRVVITENFSLWTGTDPTKDSCSFTVISGRVGPGGYVVDKSNCAGFINNTYVGSVYANHATGDLRIGIHSSPDGSVWKGTISILDPLRSTYNVIFKAVDRSAHLYALDKHADVERMVWNYGGNIYISTIKDDAITDSRHLKPLDDQTIYPLKVLFDQDSVVIFYQNMLEGTVEMARASIHTGKIIYRTSVKLPEGTSGLEFSGRNGRYIINAYDFDDAFSTISLIRCY